MSTTTKFIDKREWIVHPQNNCELLCEGYRMQDKYVVGADFYWDKDESRAIAACRLASAAPRLLRFVKHVRKTLVLPAALEKEAREVIDKAEVKDEGNFNKAEVRKDAPARLGDQ